MLEEILNTLPPARVNIIKEVCVEASLAYELGGDWRQVFKRAKYKHKGKVRKFFAIISKIPEEKMQLFVKTFEDNL